MKVDIFSAGIIFYTLYWLDERCRLIGTSPFTGKDQDEVMKKNKEGVVRFSDEHWKSFSPEAQRLAEAMLSKDPARRIAVREALAHPWFSAKHSAFVRTFSAHDKISKYNVFNRFKMERIKPEFAMHRYTPLLQPVLNRPTAASKTPQFVTKAIGKGEGVAEGRKVLNKVILVRNLGEKEEESEGETNFNSDDIDEPHIDSRRLMAIELSVKRNKNSIMPENEANTIRLETYCNDEKRPLI
eukprot:TRINITY_DN10709_c0_g1_i4.p2 TRINITY_DN10709_c0_g1~~TRINITY_DN10709_c0_g1_i4.p2  ORF type:complete len:241 (+),score=69.04 TRINITY_DN10709_c0_g1_i4:1176-1898(+)